MAVAGRPHRLVLGNEKGGTGKSTTAVHLAMALHAAGRRVVLADLDHRQRSTARWMENRARWNAAQGADLHVPPVRILVDDSTDPDAALDAFLAEVAGVSDIIVIDTPGRDSPLGRAALARADTLVTPINDSFMDLDLLGEVDGANFRVTKPSFYADLVWKARQKRARADGTTVDWVVLRNRLSPLEARNRRRVGEAMAELAKRVGFRVVPGLSERVIYRELFPRGLTLLDADQLSDPSVSHIAARAELRELVSALALDTPAGGLTLGRTG